MAVELIRTHFSVVQTLGELLVYDDDTGKVLFDAKTMELDMDGNKEGESCIPYGTYELIPLKNRPDHVKFSMQNYGYFPYLVKNVPNRTGILLHHANFYDDLLGCVAPGESFYDIDSDGHKDVTNSIATMKELNKVVKEPTTITIKGSTLEHRPVPAATLT